jgi:hypothetical protein
MSKEAASVDWKSAAKKLREARKGNSMDDMHYRVYMRAIEAGQPAEHLAKKFEGSKEAKQDLIDEVGKAPKQAAVSVALRFAGHDKSAPQKVDKYFKEVKKSNPEYSDEQAWATAWSIYCKHVKPGDASCHQEEYFPGKKTAGYSYATKTMSVVFLEGRKMAKPFNIDTIQEINHESLQIQVEGEEFDVEASLKVVGHQSSGPLTYAQEKSGLRREVRVDVEYPLGVDGSDAASANLALQVLQMIGHQNGYKVKPCSRGYQPKTHKV